ncbi:hypothetical protein C8R46DRAFT_1341629 [Mycena filopes]|nr:hypothetical protein C8R46DRAFT_1341629 [Mycena filopes]
MSSSPKPSIAVSRLSLADAHAAATVQVHAMSAHAIQLRIQPLDRRPPTPTQIDTKAQRYRDLLAAGTNRIVKASIPNDNDSSTVAGVAVWVLFDGGKPQLEDGVVPVPPRERTKEEDEEALVGVDVEIRKQIGVTSSQTRNEAMGNSRYWYLSFMAVHPKYQKRGVGQALLRWGLDQADAEELEVYLESSDEGLRLYEKNRSKLAAWNVLPDEQNEGGALKWPALKRSPTRVV